MPRLIDADAANVDYIPCYYGSNCHVEDVEEWLKDQPTVDAVPVVHGQWERSIATYWRWRDYGAVGVNRTTYRCSECDKGSAVKHNYCPNCGAKMDGGNDAENH